MYAPRCDVIVEKMECGERSGAGIPRHGTLDLSKACVGDFFATHVKSELASQHLLASDPMRKILLPVSGPRMAIVVGSAVFVTSYAENKVLRMHWPSCTQVHACARVFRPRGIVHHKGRLFVACYGKFIGKIVCLDPATLHVVHSFQTYRPRGIDVWNDLLVVTQVNRDRVVLLDEHGKVHRRFHGLKEPRDVCVCGDLAYVAATDSNAVWRVNLINNERSVVNTCSRPNGVATNGTTAITALWNAGKILLQYKNDTLEYVAHTPCMASYTRGKYIVCDDGANCMYVFDV